MSNIIEKVCDAVENIVESKIQSFDRTIQAIVYSNEDPDGIGEIQVEYKDAIIKVYTDINNVKQYRKGSHVYITVPNNNMSERKTILGLVEKLGPLTVINSDFSYSTNNRVVFPTTAIASADGFIISDSFLNRSSRDIIFSYMKDTNGIWRTICSIDGVVTTNHEYLKNFFEGLKYLIIQGKSCRLSGDFTVILDPALRNSGGDYSLSLVISGKSLTNLNSIKSRTVLSLEQINGNPFLLSEQNQSVISNDFVKFNNEFELNSIQIIYHREGFQDVADNNINAFIGIKNIVIESVTQESLTETEDLAIYISTPKGKTFMPSNDSSLQEDGSIATSLTLEAVLKENKVQINNSDLKCIWYERDPSQTSTKDFNIAGWKKLNSDNSFQNPLYIYKKDLANLSSKDYKVIGYYGGQELTNTVTIYNLENESDFTLVKNNNKYTLETKNVKDTIGLKWYYQPLNEPSKLIKSCDNDQNKSAYFYLIKESDRNSITINTEVMPYDGTILCEVYKIDQTKIKSFLAAKTQPYIADNSNDVKFNNFEQVFLYDINGNLTFIGDENEEANKYCLAVRPLSITGKVSDITWIFPKAQNSLIIGIDNNRIDEYSTINSKDKNTISFYINPKYSSDKNDNNIIVKYKNEADGKYYMQTTHFTFVKEGEDGTNGTGAVCLITPQVKEKEIPPNTVMMGYHYKEAGSSIYFNYSPPGITSDKDLNDNGWPFQVQIWEHNKKIFEGAVRSIENNVSNIKWETFSSSALTNPISISEKGRIKVNINNPAIVNEDKSLNASKENIGIKVTINYNGQQLLYKMPFITFFSNSIASKNIPNSDKLKSYSFGMPVKDGGWCASRDYGKISKFYYNDNGEAENYRMPIDFTILYEKDSLGTWEKVNGIINNNYLYDFNNGEVDIQAKKSFPGNNNRNFLLFEFNNLSLGEFYFAQIPLQVFTIAIGDSTFIEWSGEQPAVEDKTNSIFAKTIAAGKKEINNSFTGSVLGCSGDKRNGLTILKQGERQLYINQDGNIEMGADPSERLVINNKDKTIGENIDGKLKIDFKNNLISLDESTFINKNNFIEINSAKKSSFIVTKEGTLKLQRIEIGEEDTDRGWLWRKKKANGEYDILNKEDDKMPILVEDGKVGLQELYVGYGQNSTISDTYRFRKNGWTISPSAISYNMYRPWGLNDTAIVETDGGLYLSKDGIVVAKDKNRYAVLDSDGYVIASQGVLVGGSSSNYGKQKDDGWRISKDGIFNANRKVSIKADEAFLPHIKTPSIEIENSIETGGEMGSSQDTYYIGMDGKIWYTRFKNGIKVSGDSESGYASPIDEILAAIDALNSRVTTLEGS